jgi:phosphate-selective porin OprO and OprP
MVCSAAWAQESPEAPPPGPASAGPPVVAGWQDGFVLRSPDDAYRLTLGAAIQMDGRFSLDHPPSITNTFLLRKVRPVFTGRIARYFDFRLVPDFGNGVALMQDAYFEIHFSDRLRLRTGKEKTTVGYEVMLGDAYLLFPERSLAASLMPNRDIGVSARGVFGGGRLLYEGGLFNGLPDGSTGLAPDVDTNAPKDLAGRLVIQPFKALSAQQATPLSGVGFEVGGTTGVQNGVLPFFRTSSGQPYFTYTTAATADGHRDRESAATFYYYRSIGAFAEYTRSAQSVTAPSATATVANQAWEVTGSYVVTGEPTSDRGVRPAKSFDPPNHHWGALQLIARYGSLNIDDVAFANGFAGSNASGGARAIGVGLNWYLTPYVRYYAAFERTRFEAGLGAMRPSEHVVTIRAQLAF